jgi:hypothetical protein
MIGHLMWPNQALQATAGKRLGWQVGRPRPAVPELIRSATWARWFDGETFCSRISLMTRMFFICAIRAIRGYSFGAQWQGRPPL